MLKRANEGMGREEFASTSDGVADSQQKRRKIQFEPVRMPAVSNVNDMKSRAAIYQGAKLKQQLGYKNKRIAELERDNERCRRRQMTDEANFMKIYNFFSEVAQYICTQTRNEFGEFPGCDTAPSGVIVQGFSSEQYLKFVDDMKLSLRNAFISYAKARQERSAEQSRFIQKIKAVLDDPRNRIDTIHRELADRAVTLAEHNDKLQIELTKYQSEAYNSDRKKRMLQDKYETLNQKADELEKQLEDARFETDKQMRLANKFEYRLANLVSEGAGTSTGAATPSQSELSRNTAPATPPSEQVMKEIETLRLERDEKAELSAKRLQELSDANRKIQSMAAEISKLKVELQTQPPLSTEAVHNSEDFKNLKRYYSLAVKEYERVSKELEDVALERDKLRSISDQRFYSMCEEQAKTLKEIQAQSEVHNQFYKIMHDNEILRAEFDAVALEHSKTVKQADWDELKNTINTLRSLNSTLKSDVVRQREKNKAARQEIHALKSDVKRLKETQEKCLLVPLDEAREMSVHPEEYSRMRQEYDGLRRELRRLGAQEKAEKAEQVQREVEKQLGAKLAELETLRRTNETLENDEQCISDELEAIGTAVEEMQERNSQLVREKREQEDRNLKMMNDRMIQNQVQNRMREKIEAFEKKADVEAQLTKMHEFRLKGVEEQNEKFVDVLQYKAAELTRVNNSLEHHRKLMAEIALARDEYQMKVEKCEAQVTNLKDMFTSKSREVEDLRYKRSRIEEELEMMRSRYEKLKRNEASGGPGGDQVLEEANRQMKETLTCPSCKTRPKDCIMLKCYHLFCETCIKTMYDTRQRKCPKCNSNFGANDFHRVFI